jgi:hypothetical protein
MHCVPASLLAMELIAVFNATVLGRQLLVSLWTSSKKNLSCSGSTFGVMPRNMRFGNY